MGFGYGTYDRWMYWPQFGSGAALQEAEKWKSTVFRLLVMADLLDWRQEDDTFFRRFGYWVVVLVLEYWCLELVLGELHCSCSR